MSVVVAVVVSYLIGSISPSFLLGKVVKGIDIREHGDGNAGGANTFATVGVVPGILTAAFDVSKGLIALALASSLFGLSGDLLMIPIAAAIVGHVFPFYLRFRGGQGAGTAVGVFFYIVAVLMLSGRLPWEAVALVALIGGVVALVTQAAEFIGVAMIPLLIYEVLHFTGFAYPSLAGALLLVYLLGVTSYNFLRKGILASDVVRERDWGAAILAASGTGVLLLRSLWGWEPAVIASLAVALLLAALAFSLRRRPLGQREGGSRAGSPPRGEGATPQAALRPGAPVTAGSVDPAAQSSARPASLPAAGALLYLAALLVVLLFSRSVACLSLSFLVGGKLFGEIFGSERGFRPVVGGNTLRTAIAFLCGCLAAGEVVSSSLGLALPPLFVGVAAAFAAALFLPRPYETPAAALLGGLALWIIGLPAL